MKVLILLTDGQQTYIPGFTEPATVAMELRQQHDVDIFAIGIGQEVNIFIFVFGEKVLVLATLESQFSEPYYILNFKFPSMDSLLSRISHTRFFSRLHTLPCRACLIATIIGFYTEAVVR